MVRIGRYCRVCWRFVEYGPKGSGLEWLEDPCDWCVERERKREAELKRLVQMWALRECAAPDCSEVFAPATTRQRFHDDRCRKRTQRWSKARRAAEPSA
jgi:hypothetical protein